MPFVSTPDFPVEKGQREPQTPAGFGGNAALRRPQDPSKISWDPLQLEFSNNLSPLELGQLSLVRDYCQISTLNGPEQQRIISKFKILFFADLQKVLLKWRARAPWFGKKRIFLKGISGQDPYLNCRNFIWNCHSLVLIFHDLILKSVYFCKYILLHFLQDLSGLFF